MGEVSGPVQQEGADAPAGVAAPHGELAEGWLCALVSMGLERVTRIELALSAWEADVLPLNYTRKRRPLYLVLPSSRTHLHQRGSKPPKGVPIRT